MRKALALVLLLVLIVSSVPVRVQAAHENTYQNTGDQRADIIGVALTQLYYQEGKGTGSYNNDTKYGDWAGHPKTEWCGWFVSWCARQANIPTSVLATCGKANPSGFGLKNYYTSSQYTPRPGDLFFKKNFGHVGIVYYVDGNYFYTLEGNTSTSGYEGHSVMSRRRALNEFYFASPNYTSDSGEGAPPAHTHNYQQGWESSHPHREYKKCACGDSYYTGNTRTVDTCSTCKKQNCSHSYGSWVDNGSSNHVKTCSKCGDKVTQSHDWEDGEITQEPTCKDKGKMEQTCSVCDRDRTQTLDKLEEHIYRDWITDGEEKHKRICEFCEEEQVEPHVLLKDDKDQYIWEGDEKEHWYQCADCQQKLQVKEHTLEQKHDGEKHWMLCTECNQILEEKQHDFTHGCDPDCNVCPFTRETEHIFTDEITVDGENHWYACIHCDEIKGLEAHTYHLIPWEEDTRVESCSVCGYMSGKVVVKSQWEKLQEKAVEILTMIGSWILPFQLESKWYIVAAVTAIVLALAILITVPCVIVHAVKKKKKVKV